MEDRQIIADLYLQDWWDIPHTRRFLYRFHCYLPTIRIRTPRFKGIRKRGHMIGLEEDKILKYGGALVVIEHKNRDGELLYPGVYFCSKELAEKGFQECQEGVLLRWVNIADLEKVYE
jgi:hypothetical protein